MSGKEIILIGYSGHGFVVAEAAISINMNLKYYSEKEKVINNPYDLSYIGFENEENFVGWTKNVAFILGIGDNQLRHKIAKQVCFKEKEMPNVIHNEASLSKSIQIGKGNFIARNVSVNPFVTIKNFCILNTGCIIEHECFIEESSHIGPGAVLAGNVKIGQRTFVGANSIIKQGVTIGNDVVIGAGAVVLNDILDGKKVVGNPAREI